MTARTIISSLASTLLIVGGTTPTKEALAAPLEINVLNRNHTTSLQSSGFGSNPPILRTQASQDAVNDHVYQETPINPRRVDILDAAAAASTFEVMSSGRTVYQSASASAASEMTFTPLQDGSANLTINFGRLYDYGFTKGHISIFDNTSNQELFNYEWAMLGHNGNIPWNSTENVAKISFTEDFDDEHTYRLAMSTEISSNRDTELARISLSGLQVSAVPEPSTYALMLAGLGAAGFAAFRRKGGPGVGGVEVGPTAAT